MPKTETLNLRISSDFKRRLAEEAAKEKRSVTNYLEATLTRFWEESSAKAERKPEKISRH
jgi:predicted HicB family RNase H-like nuclease